MWQSVIINASRQFHAGIPEVLSHGQPIKGDPENQKTHQAVGRDHQLTGQVAIKQT